MKMKSSKINRLLLAGEVLFAVSVLVGSGCRPPFPKCRDDGDCKAEEGNTTLLKCCNQQCQECCQDADCPAERKKCKENRCVECIVNEDCPAEKPFCENEKCTYECEIASDCDRRGKAGMICRDHKCQWECETDADCQANMECKDYHCVPKCACQSDADCPEGLSCEDCNCIKKECRLEAIYFDFDKYNIRSDAQPVLDKNAECLKKSPGKRITVEGHCDERGTEEYNIALGERRAKAARDYLIKLGINKGQLNTISYGESRPVCNQETEDCWQQNRRAEFVEK